MHEGGKDKSHVQSCEFCQVNSVKVLFLTELHGYLLKSKLFLFSNEELRKNTLIIAS